MIRIISYLLVFTSDCLAVRFHNMHTSLSTSVEFVFISNFYYLWFLLVFPGVCISCYLTEMSSKQYNLVQRRFIYLHGKNRSMKWDHASSSIIHVFMCSCILRNIKTKICCIITHQPYSYLIVLLSVLFLYLYFCPHLQPCFLLVPVSHRSSNLSNPLSRLCAASWPWTAPPWGEDRCSDTHSTEHQATCGIGAGKHPTMSKCAHTKAQTGQKCTKTLQQRPNTSFLSVHVRPLTLTKYFTNWKHNLLTESLLSKKLSK